MNCKFLTALPVYNEARHVAPVLQQVRQFSEHVLVVDDGSTDETSRLLAGRPDIRVVTHPVNRGYGAALMSAFEHAVAAGFDVLVTIDCDGQHEPQRIPAFVEACRGVDLVSGSRYLEQFLGDSEPPAQRRRINGQITAQLNELLGLQLTDAFCGFKAYRVASLAQLSLTETGYGMPIELWVQAAQAHWRIVEYPVPLIYLDEQRSFGGALDDGQTRLAYYHRVLQRSLAAAPAAGSCCGVADEDAG